MKIAIISDHIPYNAAHSINIMKHSDAFFNLGHEVEVLAVERLREKLNLLKISDIYDFYDVNPQIKIKYFRDNSLLYFREINLIKNYSYILTTIFRKFLPNVLNVLSPENKISKYCKKNKIDLAYCRRTYEAAIYNIFNNVSTIVETHNPKIIDPFLKKLLILSKNKYFIGLITISDVLKKIFIERGVPEEKILVLEDAVDLQKFDSIHEEKNVIRNKLNLPLNREIILHLGRLSEGRGIDTILDATKFLEKENYLFYFIGGEKNEIRKWKKYIKNNMIKAEVIFFGFKKNKLIPFFLKSADILLAPYSFNCETVNWMSPIKIFEYMGSKIPVIASDLKRLKEICNNNECFFFKRNDPLDLSKKINILKNNKELQRKLTHNAYNKAKQHTYTIRCKKIIQFFNL